VRIDEEHRATRKRLVAHVAMGVHEKAEMDRSPNRSLRSQRSAFERRGDQSASDLNASMSSLTASPSQRRAKSFSQSMSQLPTVDISKARSLLRKTDSRRRVDRRSAHEDFDWKKDVSESAEADGSLHDSNPQLHSLSSIGNGDSVSHASFGRANGRREEAGEEMISHAQSDKKKKKRDKTSKSRSATATDFDEAVLYELAKEERKKKKKKEKKAAVKMQAMVRGYLAWKRM
jgi:hypothetical protein